MRAQSSTTGTAASSPLTDGRARFKCVSAGLTASYRSCVQRGPPAALNASRRFRLSGGWACPGQRRSRAEAINSDAWARLPRSDPLAGLDWGSDAVGPRPVTGVAVAQPVSPSIRKALSPRLVRRYLRSTRVLAWTSNKTRFNHRSSFFLCDTAASLSNVSQLS